MHGESQEPSSSAALEVPRVADTPTPRRPVASRARAAAIRCGAAGVVAWLITVSPILFARAAPFAARLFAAAALVASLAGTQAIQRHHRLARALGITAFLGFAGAAWGLAAGTRLLAGFDPLRGFFGVLAWATYAASWSEPWKAAGAQLEVAPPGARATLEPRRGTPVSATLVGSSGVVFGLGCLGLAWSVEEPSRAVWARAIGVLAAVSLSSAAASIAVIVARDGHAGSAQRQPVDGRIIRALCAIALLVAAGFAIARLH